MKKTILFFALATGVLCISAQEDKGKASKGKKAEPTVVSYSFKIIDAPNHTYGYDIFSGETPLVHQTSIPSMPGTDGFRTKMDAQKVAKVVIQKIAKGEMPPTMTVEELKALKVVK